MTSDVLISIQATAAAVSALTAGYLVRLTIHRDRDQRQQRDRDLVQDQLRRIVDGLSAIWTTIRDPDAFEPDMDVALAQLAAALALRLVELPACAALTAADMPKPPYGLGDTLHWDRLQAALTEVRAYAHSIGVEAGP